MTPPLPTLRTAACLLALAAPLYLVHGQAPAAAPAGKAAASAADRAAVPVVTATPAEKSRYVLGTGDQLSVRIFGADDLPATPVEVGSDGAVSLPMVGKVDAAGSSVRQFEEALTAKYKRYFKDPQVSVAVTDYRSEPVTVLGAVNLPNVLELRGPTRLMQVISLAGGLRADAGSRVVVTRQNTKETGDRDSHFISKEIDLAKIIDGTDPSVNILVEKDDVITVPKAKLVYVVGEVAKPGGYVLDGHSSSLSVLKAIALAGGINRTASSKNGKILTAGSDGDAHHTEESINLDKILANKSPDVALHADDILFVPGSGTKRVGIRVLEAAANIGTGMAIYR